ncbi:uncharacterized mitochondrial protein AtMg00810-like [Solanum tuberosum]|uniref:uncharacterized mitochondrial protein AtMg00810-like n=1 Tax=Solanum tuberosum TaxID=4113 RepID=UPI00073A3ED0|nr:PREDICTED: uncharacterized mitochondrial protein AtMg00810-like [Solanum tuberosum]
MDVSPGLTTPRKGLVCRLNKSLYGLKQASRQWYEKLTEALHTRGYVRSLQCYSLFYRKRGASSVFLSVYVDDILLTGINTAEIDELKRFLDSQFKIKDLGRLHYFLGLEVLYKDDGIMISQRKFVLDLLKKFKCDHMTPLSSPLDPNVKLKSHEGKALDDPTYYRKLVDKLNFLTNTKLDLAYGVQLLSEYMQDPMEPYLHAAFHMLRCLKKDPTLGVFMSSSANFGVQAYCDSDWAAYPDSRKSVSGCIVLLGDGPIS